MIVYLFLGFVALFLCSYLHNKEKGLSWAFFLITVFLSIRYMWGNDYPAYLKDFQEYNNLNFSLFDIGRSSDARRNNEFGWVIIMRLFGQSGLGFFGFVIATTIFECAVVYQMIKKYVTPNKYSVALSLWYFSAQSFCVNASMMRQYLCMCIFLIVIDLMIEKQKRWYLLISIGLIILSMTIHRSSVVLLASLPLFYIKLSRTKNIWVIIWAGIFLLWQLYGRSLIEPYVALFLESSEDYQFYMTYMGDENTGINSSGLGVIFRYVMFVVWLLLLPSFEKKQQQPIVILLIVSYFFDVIAIIAPLAGRLGLYFSFLSMICWAWLFEKGKQYTVLYLLFVIQIAIIIRTIPQFFYSPLWSSSFLYYHTIFSAPNWM